MRTLERKSTHELLWFVCCMYGDTGIDLMLLVFLRISKRNEINENEWAHQYQIKNKAKWFESKEFSVRVIQWNKHIVMSKCVGFYLGVFEWEGERSRWLLAIEWNPFISSLISDCGVTSVQKCVLVLIHLTFDWIFMMCARRAKLDIKQFAEKAIHSVFVCLIHPSTDGRTGLIRYIHTDQLFAVNAIRLHIIICVDAMMLVDGKHTWLLILVGCCYLMCACVFFSAGRYEH